MSSPGINQTRTVSPRIAPVEAPYSEEVNSVFDRLMPAGMQPIGLFRTVAHNPRVLQRMQRGGLLDPGSISLRAREIIILRTTALCGAEYEWGVHVAFFAAQAAFSEAEVAATVHGKPEDWPDPAEAVLIKLADALHAGADIQDHDWPQIKQHWDDAQVIELAMLAGLYHAVSYICNVSAVANEPGAPGFAAG